MACFITAISCQDMCRHLITHPHFVFFALHLALFPAEASAMGFIDGALSGSPSEQWDIPDKDHGKRFPCMDLLDSISTRATRLLRAC